MDSPPAPTRSLREPVYGEIGRLLRARILAGHYDPSAPGTESPLPFPSAAEVGLLFGVSRKTGLRAIQELAAEGLVTVQAGLRPAVVERRAVHPWPATGRYARARSSGGLVFGEESPILGDVRKQIVDVSLVTVPQSVRHLLGAGLRDRVWARSRQTVVDGRVIELSTSYFPESVAARAHQLLRLGVLPPGGVVAVLETAGFIIVRTMNEVRARIARDVESIAFGIDPELSRLEERVVLELTHGTYGHEGEPVEAVVSVRQAREHVLTFETEEQPGAESRGGGAGEPADDE